MPLRFPISLVAALLAVGSAACARGPEFPDRTAAVTVDGRSRSFALDSCGLDEHTAFLVGRADDGAIVQAVVGLEDDDATGVPESTGATVDLDPTSEDSRVAAFGAEAWERRGSGGAVPGEIAASRVRGSRIQLSGAAVAVDADDRPVVGAVPVAFTVDARCDEQE